MICVLLLFWSHCNLLAEGFKCHHVSTLKAWSPALRLRPSSVRAKFSTASSSIKVETDSRVDQFLTRAFGDLKKQNHHHKDKFADTSLPDVDASIFNDQIAAATYPLQLFLSPDHEFIGKTKEDFIKDINWMFDVAKESAKPTYIGTARSIGSGNSHLCHELRRACRYDKRVLGLGVSFSYPTPLVPHTWQKQDKWLSDYPYCSFALDMLLRMSLDYYVASWNELRDRMQLLLGIFKDPAMSDEIIAANLISAFVKMVMTDINKDSSSKIGEFLLIVDSSDWANKRYHTDVLKVLRKGLLRESAVHESYVTQLFLACKNASSLGAESSEYGVRPLETPALDTKSIIRNWLRIYGDSKEFDDSHQLPVQNYRAISKLVDVLNCAPILVAVFAKHFRHLFQTSTTLQPKHVFDDLCKLLPKGYWYDPQVTFGALFGALFGKEVPMGAVERKLVADGLYSNDLATELAGEHNSTKIRRRDLSQNLILLCSLVIRRHEHFGLPLRMNWTERQRSLPSCKWVQRP
jgi:hypothetical protein